MHFWEFRADSDDGDLTTLLLLELGSSPTNKKKLPT